MIRYALVCNQDHEFEGWFGSSADYDKQSEQGLLSCPVCASAEVGKAPMAPAVSRARGEDVSPADMIAKVRAHIREKFDYVGERFADEARAIHEGEAPDRPIWGEATPAEAQAMKEEGLPVAPLPAPLAPVPPRKLN